MPKIKTIREDIISDEELKETINNAGTNEMKAFIIRGFFILSIIIIVFSVGVSINTSYVVSKYNAQYVGPSANEQWQNAMAWARENTSEDALFAHWWDYGYFVQTIGERATVSDGGHVQGDRVTHYIGRYILTTPNPATAMSFMKTWEVDYLLIDPTEMGKYGAFSKIGSNDSWDRVSAGIFGGAIDEQQSSETANGMIEVYQLRGCVDEDISYKDGENKVFIPGISITKTQQMNCNSYVLGAIVNFSQSEESVSIGQPEAVYLYGGKQYRLPLRYVYSNGEIFDFGKGVEGVAYFIPAINSRGMLAENGAMIYLSPRTFNSLMGKLYILNDPFNEYPTLSEALFEDDPIVKQIKSMFGSDVGEFVWYQGLRAPLKIWSVEYPENTPTYDQFISRENPVYGDMDGYF